jgi:phosphoenolpyruvate carboxylase
MGVKLPRAIPFVASLYSIGLPPEILGLNVLSKDEIKFIKSIYLNFKKDLSDSLKYINLNSPYIPKEIKKKLEELEIDFDVDLNHKELTDSIINSIKDFKIFGVDELILKAALIRKFLG